MKKLHLHDKSTPTPKLARDLTPAHEEQNQLQNGSLSLSPERIRAGATAKTDVMNEILQRDTHFNYSRHWGINE